MAPSTIRSASFEWPMSKFVEDTLKALKSNGHTIELSIFFQCDQMFSNLVGRYAAEVHFILLQLHTNPEVSFEKVLKSSEFRMS